MFWSCAVGGVVHWRGRTATSLFRPL